MKTNLILAAIVLPLLCPIACDGPTPSAADGQSAAETRGIVGSSWLAEDIAGKGLIDDARTFVQFLSETQVAGSGGVNRFSGGCTIDGTKLTFGTLAVTRMAGPPAAMTQENVFLTELDKVAFYKLDDNDLLHFLDKDGNELVRLSRSDNDSQDNPEGETPDNE